MKGMGGHHSPRPDKEEWLTPPWLLAKLGRFDLDPCAPINRPWPTADEHFTIRDDGLLMPWSGRVFLNPPYSTAQLKLWLPKMVMHGRGTALIFARTETDSFFRYVWEAASAVLFLEGRLFFHHVDGRVSIHNSGAPSVLCAYGREDADMLEVSGVKGKFLRLT